jgi:hypothetical protein
MKKNYLVLLLVFVTTLSYSQLDLSVYNLDFSGKTSSETTNTNELQKALNDAAIAGEDIVLPPGTLRLDGTLTVPSGVDIEGAGIFSSLLFWKTSFTGYGFDGTNFSIKNMEIRKSNSLANGAIRCNGGSFSASFIQILNRWKRSLDIRNCTSVSISNSRILGSNSGSNITEANVFISNSTNINILDTHIRTAQHGILFEGESENITMKTISCTNLDYGIRFNTTTFHDNILIDGADISGCNISSVLLLNVKNAIVRNTYGVLKNYDGSTTEGTFHIDGPNSNNILLDSVIVNNNNEQAASSGIKIVRGQNITINYFSNTSASKPIEILSNVKNVTINGGVRRSQSNDKFYILSSPENVTITNYTYYSNFN